MMKLTPVMEKYILHWGEMGNRWGVNRSIAQIHALLYLAGEPQTAESIAATLGVARSNVSTSLKELQSWGLVQTSTRLGDRRDYFESLGNVWDIFMVILEQRKHREVDPTLSLLRECQLESSHDDETDPAIKTRITETLSFMEMMSDWYDQVKRMPPSTIARIMKLGAGIQNLLNRSE